MNLQGIAEAYSQVHEKKDPSYLETDMKKRQKNNEKARKDMKKMGSMSNPHFGDGPTGSMSSEEMSADEKSMKKFQELQKNVDQKKKNIRGNDSAEQKKRLEKKRGMKLDDHPQFKKEEVSGIAAAYQAVYNKVEEEVEDIEEADSLAAMAARREKRLAAQRKREGTTASGRDFGHDYSLSDKQQKARRDAEFKAGMKKEEVEQVAEADSLAAMAARREKRLKAQRKKMGTSATGQDFGHDYSLTAAERKKRQDKEFDAFIGRGKKKTNEEVEAVDEGLTGVRADRARQMQDSDTKSKGGKRTPADRDTAFRLGTGTAEKGTRKVGGRGGDEYGDRGRGNAAKRRMKEELEATGKFTAEEIEAILEHEIEEGAPIGAALGNIAGRTIGAKLGGSAGAEIGKYAGAAGGAAALAPKGKKGKKAAGAALGSVIPGMGVGLGSAAGAALANSHEMEGNPVFEATKKDIQQYAVNEIAGALKDLASAGASAVKGLGAMGGETGTQIANAVVKGGKDVVKLAKKHPITTAAVGGTAAGLAAGKMMDND